MSAPEMKTIDLAKPPRMGRVVVATAARALALVVILLFIQPGLRAMADGAADDAADSAAAGEAGEGERFIFLDDGSGPAVAPSSLGTSSLSGEHGRIPGVGGGAHESRKLPRFFLDESSRGLSAPLASPDSFVDSFAMPGPSRSLRMGYGHFESETMIPSGFGVWLTTETTMGESAGFSPATEMQTTPGHGQRNQNVAVGLGYNGFAFAASLRHEADAFDRSYRGFDFGVGYQGRSWFTNVEYAGYQYDRGPLFHSFLGDQKSQSLQIGAGYALWPGLTFSGRFRFFDYSNPLWPGVSSDQEHVFSLGTRLNF